MNQPNLFVSDAAPSNFFPVHTNCDLAEAYAFRPSHSAPPSTVLAAFGSGPLHLVKLSHAFDMDRAASAHAEHLVRSVHTVAGWECILIQLAPKEFLWVESRQLHAYAESHGRAVTIAEEFWTAFSDTSGENLGRFQLLSKEHYGSINTQSVSLTPNDTLDDDTMDAMYPDGMLAFDRSFREALACDRGGLSLFEGEPGTGKTTYLRHLVGSLRETHRFYYVPPSGMDMLVGPEFIEFWTSERKRHAKLNFVAFLEDGDSALMSRDADNREVVSAILNLADGLLGNFLRLHIVCTINCPSTTIDQALLRPGRLVMHHLFRRLPAEKARKLAAAKQRELPERDDFTLAEVFCGSSPHTGKPHHLGFGLPAA